MYYFFIQYKHGFTSKATCGGIKNSIGKSEANNDLVKQTFHIVLSSGSVSHDGAKLPLFVSKEAH